MSRDVAHDDALRRYRRERIAQALLWIAVGLLSIFLTVLVLLPASWVAPELARATGGRLLLADPQGSLWDGSAGLMLSPGGADAAGATVLPYRISWHTQAWPLLTGRLRAVVQQEGPQTQPVVIDASVSSVTVFSGSIAVPASLLNGLGAPFNTLAIEGNVRLDWTDWRLLGNPSPTQPQGGGAYGQLTVDIIDAGSRLSPLHPLGSYRAVVRAAGQSMSLTLSTLSGPLQLSGQGQMQDGHFHFMGKAEADPKTGGNLTGLLSLLGHPINSQSTALQFDR